MINIKSIVTIYFTAVFLAAVVAVADPLFCSAESETTAGMRITSPAFTEGGMIPRQFALDAKNINPPLVIEDIPKKTRSLALIVEDPDAPRGTWIHWIVYDIPVTNRIKADSVPGREGLNDFRRRQYDGPSPPSGTHRYVFKVYALDRMLGLKEGATRQKLEEAMRGHILARAKLTGLYRRY